jgi:DNA-binding MarR family transcriptional regulator
MDREVLTLARLSRMLERACSESAQPPLTLAQYRLLAMIGDGTSQASHLAGRLALAKPTVSATLDTLVERGLVDRTTAPDDRRVTSLSLTDAGRAAVRDAEASMRVRLDGVLAHVDQPEMVRAALAALGHGLDVRREERHAARMQQ